MNVTERDTKKGVHWIYVLAGLYVLSAYIAPVMSYFMIKYAEDTLFPWVSLTIPISMGIVNSIVIPTNRYEIGRVRLINCALFIKLALVPLYIVGGLLNVLFFLLMFTPVVIMIFVSPMAITMLSVLGWLYMAGVAPYSLTYLLESGKLRVHNKTLCVIVAILQFFFVADVISVIIMAIKEKQR